MARQPALVLGEIAWRWAFGVAAWALVVFAVRRILATVDVTHAELLIARHSDLFVIADACARIVVQVLPQLARECLVLVPAIAVLWTAAATVGRGITLNALLSVEAQEPVARNRAPFGQLTILNCLRAVFTLAAASSLVGAMLAVGALVQFDDVAVVAAISITLAAIVAFFWSVVNWYLALAPIWIMGDARPVLPAIAESVNFSRRLARPYSAITLWFGLFRGIAFVVALLAAMFTSQASPAASVSACVAIAVAYFAVADFLYLARLAAFVALEQSSQLSAISTQPLAPEPLTPAPAPPASHV